MKKVLFVATVVKTHIMEFHIPYLEMFKDMGWETAVASRNDYENKKDCNIPFCDKFFDLPFERSPFKPSNLKVYKQLKRIIEEEKYDIIHCHTPVGAMLARLAARNARKKGTRVIYTAHGFHFYSGAPIINWLLYYPVERFLARYTDVLITINQEDFERAQGFKAKKVRYVRGVGVDAARFGKALRSPVSIRTELGIGEDDVFLLSVGEVNKNKNHRSVIEAMSKLPYKNVYYVVCGQGPLVEEHKALAAKLGIGERVIFAGYRNDVGKFYNEADAFVFPSLREGLSVALMEAMACKMPIICSRIRGNVDLVENEVSGLTVEPNADAIAEAIKTLYESKELRERFAAAAGEKIKSFELDAVKQEYQKIYFAE